MTIPTTHKIVATANMLRVIFRFEHFAAPLILLQVGDEFTTPLNIEYSNRWRDVWILFCYFVFNFIATIGR